MLSFRDLLSTPDSDSRQQLDGAESGGNNGDGPSEESESSASAVHNETSPLLPPVFHENLQQNYNTIVAEPTDSGQCPSPRKKRSREIPQAPWSRSHELGEAGRPPSTSSLSRFWGLGPSWQKDSNSYRQSWLLSWKKRSRSLSIDPSSHLSNVSREPLVIFKDLLDLLLSYDVPGPLLFRMHNEFNTKLGNGRTFEVFGASEQIFTEAGSSDILMNLPKIENKRVAEKIINTWEALPRVAIKRAYINKQKVSGSNASSSSEMTTRAFGQQLNAVEREIQNLCHPHLRDHKNIVKLLGWGLCLDTLENLAADGPRIPLLIVERAHSTLTDFIRGHMEGSLQSHLACDICLDVGKGLEAIHDAGLIHGDIKLDNILIFKDDTGWTAKLSDFGLTAWAQSNSNSQECFEYRGTPRWCPPPGSTRYDLGKLYAFDYFAYGLVVWCAFVGKDRSPLPSDEAIAAEPDGPFAPKNIYRTAMDELELGTWRPRTQIVLLSCLHDDSRFWRTQPWDFFDRSLHPTVGLTVDEVTITMRLRGIFNQIPSMGYSTAKALIDHTCRFWAHNFIVGEHPRQVLFKISSMFSLSPRLKLKFRVVYKSWPSKRRRLLEKYLRLLSRRFSIYIEPESLDIIGHSENTECHDFTPVIALLQDYISRLPLSRHTAKSYKQARWLDNRIEALSRIRSRIPLCCYQNSTSAENLVQKALLRHCSIGSLAWLCRGATGRSEVAHIDVEVLMSWLGLMKQKSTIDSPDVEARLILFSESGLRLDKMAAYGSSHSILFHVLELLRRLPGHDPGRFIDCLTRLQRYARDRKSSTGIPPALRYFLTGQGLSDGLGEPSNAEIDENWTTALHQCADARSYEAVESLVLGGFEVNALDKGGQTALQSLFESSSPHGVLGERLARDRILALLRQHPSKLWDPSDSKETQRRRRGLHQRLLPTGWTTTTVSDKDTQRFLYVDRHFGSLTLIKPKFSFFSDQRLALGFRQVALPGQTYYLDLLRFITAPPSLPDYHKPIDWMFSETRYEMEAAQMDAVGVYTAKDLLYLLAEKAWSSIGIIFDTTFWLTIITTSSIPHMWYWGVVQLQTIPVFRLLPITISTISKWVIKLLLGLLALVFATVFNIFFFSIPVSILARFIGWPASSVIALDLCALIGLSGLVQGSLSYLITKNAAGLTLSAAAICSIHAELSCAVFLVMNNLGNLLPLLFLGVTTLNYQFYILGDTFYGIPPPTNHTALHGPAFLSLLYIHMSEKSSILTTFLSHILPFSLLSEWALSLIFVIAVLALGHQTVSHLVQFWPGIMDLAAFAWLWKDDAQFFYSKGLRKEHIRTRDYRLSIVVLFSSLAITTLICSHMIDEAKTIGGGVQAILIYLLIPLSSRVPVIINGLLGRKFWPKEPAYFGTGGDHVPELVDYPVGWYHSPNAQTFVLWTLIYPIFDIILLGKGHPLGLHLPTLDIVRTSAVAIHQLTRLYLDTRFNMRTRLLNINSLHGFLFLFYQIIMWCRGGRWSWVQ